MQNEQTSEANRSAWPVANWRASALPTAFSHWQKKWLGTVLAVLEPLSVAGLFVYLLEKTWLRWSDPLIDFPRDLYIAWRMSEGDLLYQKITNWYGPLANLVESTGFRVFGVGLDTMVWMNIALAVAALLLLRAIFGTIGNRLSVWLGSLVFLIVFAFGHLTAIANYNFITPYVAQSTYSFLGLLLVLWGLLKHLKTDRPGWLGVAGLGLAVVYLDKPEALLAAGGALGIYFLAQSIRPVRHGVPGGTRGWLIKSLSWLLGGFMGLYLPVFVYLWSLGGAAYAWRAVNYSVAALFDSAIRNQIENEKLMQTFIGFDHPWENFLTQAKDGALLVLVCGAIIMLARRWTRARKFSAEWWVLPVGVAMAAVIAGWLGMLSDSWLESGPAFAFPVMIATLVMAWWALRTAWRDEADFSRALGLAVVGVAASLMLGRMVLNVRLSHYGFFMAPLAVWFWIHLVTVEAARPAKNLLEKRQNGLLPATMAAVVLFAAGVVLNFEVNFYATKTFPVGAGRDQFFTFPPRFSKTGSLNTNGLMLNTMIRAFHEKAPHVRTLVAFPEGIAVNYHLRVRSPLTEQEFHPLALGYMGPSHVLAELQADPPDAVLVFYRNLSEFGVQYFGQDEASGRLIMLWVESNYVLAGKAGASLRTMSRDAVDIYIPRPPGAPPPLNIGPF